MFESFFIFDGKFYQQCDGVAMGSPLGPTLANIFMFHFENIWFENCPAHPNQFFIDDSLIIHFDHSEQRIMLQSLNSISTNNMKI